MTWFGTCWRSELVDIELQLQSTISIPSTEDLRLSLFAYKLKTKWDTITISLAGVIFQPHNYLANCSFETLTVVANNCAPLLPKCFSISLQSLELNNSLTDLESCDTCKNLCPPKVRSRPRSSISDYSGINIASHSICNILLNGWLNARP